MTEPKHSYPYNAIYDNDREYDGYVPKHRAVIVARTVHPFDWHKVKSN